jgi:hypothetical protein
LNKPAGSDISRIEVIDDKTAEILRKKTPAERFKIACDMRHSVYSMLKNHLKEKHPDWDENAIRQEIARRMNLEIPNSYYGKLGNNNSSESHIWETIKTRMAEK